MQVEAAQTSLGFQYNGKEWIVASSRDHHTVTCDTSHLVTSRHLVSFSLRLTFLFGVWWRDASKAPEEIEPNPQAAVSLWHCNDVHFGIICKA